MDVAHSIVGQEREKYEEMWQMENYSEHSPGERHAELFAEVVGQRTGTVLDAGCGSGKGAIALAALGFNVVLSDITSTCVLPEAKRFPFIEACLWHDLKWMPYLAKVWHDKDPSIPTPVDGTRFDFVYCCDVMEHLPPEFTMLVVARLLEIARDGVFFSISTIGDQYGVWIGKTLHQTVRNYNWWRDNLREISTVLDVRDFGATAIFYVRQ